MLYSDPSETTRRSPLKKKETLAYLHGAMHDATLNKGRRVRFAQKHRKWLETLQKMLGSIGAKSWIYKEGRNRNVWVLETVTPQLDFAFNPGRIRLRGEQIAYLKGFFDAEGGIPLNGDRFYIQLVQKNKPKMEKLKRMLKLLNIRSGKIHNPSKKVDPDYWRLFIATSDHSKFVRVIGSYHPIKANVMRKRMMI